MFGVWLQRELLRAEDLRVHREGGLAGQPDTVREAPGERGAGGGERRVCSAATPSSSDLGPATRRLHSLGHAAWPRDLFRPQCPHLQNGGAGTVPCEAAATRGADLLSGRASGVCGVLGPGNARPGCHRSRGKCSGGVRRGCGGCVDATQQSWGAGTLSLPASQVGRAEAHRGKVIAESPVKGHGQD